MQPLTRNFTLALFLLVSLPLIAVPKVKKADNKATESRVSSKRPFSKRTVLRLVQKKIGKHQKKQEKKNRARAKDNPDKLATFALILGISAYLLVLVKAVGFFAFFVAIAAVIAGIRALKRGGSKFRAILGIVLGGVFFSLIIIGFVIAFSNASGG
ncbi:MAG: hypothetical protein KDD19_28160 [Phaeodactylibacter sp.]|nr:hypothetical protein [Phaeodactylibacter sp.]